MLALLVATAGVVVAVHGGSRHSAASRVPSADRQQTETAHWPPEIVVVTGLSRIEVLSSRTLRVIRTLATNSGLFSGSQTLAPSSSGLLFFDSSTKGPSEKVFSVPLKGGAVRTIAYGRTPAISPDGKLLAYVAETRIVPRPTGIVVRNLATGSQRTWLLANPDIYIPAMTWSPDDRHLSVTTSVAVSPTTWVLDTRAPGRTFRAARRMPLPPGVSWAGYLSARRGVGVVSASGRTSLVEVDVRTGKVIRPLTSLRQGLFSDSSVSGPEGTVQPDSTGRYFLIVGSGPLRQIPGETPGTFGEVFLWTFGMRHPVPILNGDVLAIWAGPHAG